MDRDRRTAGEAAGRQPSNTCAIICNYVHIAYTYRIMYEYISLSIHIYVYIYIYTHNVCVYIYIYIVYLNHSMTYHIRSCIS